MPCICGRAKRGFGFDTRKNFRNERKIYWFCSLDHMKRFSEQYRKDKTVLDFNDKEKQAIKAAHQFAGEWLKEKGTFDLSKLSRDEQLDFMAIIYGNVCNELSKIEGE